MTYRSVCNSTPVVPARVGRYVGSASKARQNTPIPPKFGVPKVLLPTPTKSKSKKVAPPPDDDEDVPVDDDAMYISDTPVLKTPKKGKKQAVKEEETE